MADLLEYLVRQLVDRPDAVRVEVVDGEDAVVYRLHVAPDDVGKVVGRQGRIARALRTVVRAGGGPGDRRVALEIVD
ncbi:MAG: KH domain-containing protein [Gaiellaceae bacterium]